MVVWVLLTWLLWGAAMPSGSGSLPLALTLTLALARRHRGEEGPAEQSGVCAAQRRGAKELIELVGAAELRELRVQLGRDEHLVRVRVGLGSRRAPG